MMGLDASTFSSTLVSLAEPPTVAKKRMAYFAETVLPAPDSPLTMMDWFLSSLPDGHERVTKRKFPLSRRDVQWSKVQTFTSTSEPLILQCKYLYIMSTFVCLVHKPFEFNMCV